MSKKLIIFCDGGLGNRLGSLVGGLITSKKLNRTPIICWPKNTWCGCDFVDLFEPENQVIDLDINELFSLNQNNKFIIHENQTGLNINYYYPSSENITFFQTVKDEVVIYYHNLVPNFYLQEEIISILNTLKVREKIKRGVEEFCNINLFNSETMGIHFRKTDFGYSGNEDTIFEYVKSNSALRFFVCSDSKETEIRFNELDNVIIFPKKNYVEKLVDGSWNEWITDNEGRKFKFNVNRSKESVIEAFIDLLILSKTKIETESESTFLKFAKIYKNVKL